MKRWMAGLLCIALLAALSACSGQKIKNVGSSYLTGAQNEPGSGAAAPEEAQNAVERLVRASEPLLVLQPETDPAEEAPSFAPEGPGPEDAGETTSREAGNVTGAALGGSDPFLPSTEGAQESANQANTKTAEQGAAPGFPPDAAPADEQKTTAGRASSSEDTVLIRIPAFCFQNVDLSGFDPTLFCARNQYQAAALNSDGSITIGMTRARQTEMLEEVRNCLTALLNGTVKEGMGDYIKSVQYTTDFSQISLFFYAEHYRDFKPVSSALTSAVYRLVGLYQTLEEQPVRCEICCFSAGTNEILERSVWPVAVS